jgi:hypothetical protein
MLFFVAKANIEVLVTANGGKPVVSQKQSVALAKLSDDTDADFLLTSTL